MVSKRRGLSLNRHGRTKISDKHTQRYIRHRLHVVILFFILAACIGAAGYFYYNAQKEYITNGKQNDLITIANLKLEQIINWRKERVADARVIQNNLLIAHHVQQFLQNQSSSEMREEVLSWMKNLQESRAYKNVILLDTKSNIRLWTNDEDRYVGKLALASALKAMRTKKFVISDFHRTVSKNDIHLDILIPILSPGTKDRTQKRIDTSQVGTLLLRINPYESLYPLIHSLLTFSKTAETLLIRREGDDVLFLNELRHKKNTALFLRLPISNKRLPAAMAARGKEGIVKGLDYRGVPVLAVLWPIPGSPWFLITKIDIAEIDAPIREQAWLIIMLASALGLATMVGAGFLWREESAEFYRKQYELELERKVLIEHYGYLTKYANDIILLMDYKGRILDANERAVASYGYTHDELVQLNIKNILAPETLSLLDEQLKKAEETGGLVFETIHKKKDGTTFPVEVSSRIIEIEGKRFRQSIIRDITERKEAEEKLKVSYEKLQKTLSSTVHALATTLEMRDPYTAGHQRRVAQLASAIASEMGFSQERIEGIRVMGFLHDIGKIVVPAEILSKPSKLSNYEFNIIKTHSETGYDILKEIEFPWPLATAILQHHERLNGSGYPQGLSKEDITTEAKILMVADTVEAMASHRPYRPALGIDKALEEIVKNRGILYDAEVVEICLKLFKEKGFKFE